MFLGLMGIDAIVCTNFVMEIGIVPLEKMKLDVVS